MKPTLLLLHGALGSPATLQPLADLLATDFTVEMFAFAGHGGREVAAETFNLPYFGTEVLNFLQTETSPAHVFGYSMGGYAALLAARQKPERFASLTTLGTQTNWSPETAAAAASFLNPEKMQAKVPAFVEQLRQRHAPADWAAVVAATAQLMQAAGANPPLTASDFTQLAVPVQVLVGDKEQAGGVEASAAYAAQLPQSRFEILPNTPHPLEQVDLPTLAARITIFAQQHAGSKKPAN